VISQGDVLWLELPSPTGSEPGGKRPALVLQTDRFNKSRVQTVVVATITSNLKLAAAPGNVQLRKGEAGLRKASVVNVTQPIAVDRSRLFAKVGAVSARRLAEVWAGVRLLLEPPEEITKLLEGAVSQRTYAASSGGRGIRFRSRGH
jgi:mRNA interferase MazF